MSLGVAASLDRFRPKPLPKVHCDLDDWDFAPQLTDGACPICGWRPETEEKPLPAWMVQLARVPWDYVLLGVMAAVLVVLGVIVALAAHINVLPSS